MFVFVDYEVVSWWVGDW